MTGEEHANAAAALLGDCQLEPSDGIEVYPDHEQEPNVLMALTAAQVHATLALVDAVRALAPGTVEMKYADGGPVKDLVRKDRRTTGGFSTF